MVVRVMEYQGVMRQAGGVLSARSSMADADNMLDDWLRAHC